MRTLESIAQGFRAIFQNKLRSTLTLLGITIGIAAVLGMVSISDGARQIIMADIERIGGNNQFMMFRSSHIQRNGRWMRNNSDEHFDYDDVLAIERECPSVKRVIPRVPRWRGERISAGAGETARETRASFQGVTTALQEGMDWDTSIGRFIDETDDIDWNRIAVVGSTVALELFEDADPVGSQINISGQPFTVVGVMEERGRSIQYGWDLDNTVMMPITTAQARYEGNDSIHMMTIQAVSSDKIPNAMAEVRRILDRRHNGEEFYRMWAPGLDNLEFVATLSSLLRVVLGTIAGFSLFIGGVGIMNIMLVSVTERTKEIGLRKALGGRKRDILLQFLIEASTLCFVGGIAGVALGVSFGVGSAKIISNPAIGGFIGPLLGFQGDWVSWPFNISTPWIVLAMGVSLAVGVVFGLWPAWKAAKLEPINALRHSCT